MGAGAWEGEAGKHLEGLQLHSLAVGRDRGPKKEKLVCETCLLLEMKEERGF